MPQIISIHSFRRGTGKSTVTANLAALLALDGWRVGVIDTNIQAPSLHILFGLDDTELVYSLNDYLLGECMMIQAAYNVAPHLGINGTITLIPSSTHPKEVIRILRDGYDSDRLEAGIDELAVMFKLDVLLIDTCPGLTEETLRSIIISDLVLLVMRPDQQDYQGTGVTIEVARKLETSRLALLVNNLPPHFDPAQVRDQVQQVYNVEMAGVLHHSGEMLSLGSTDIFTLRYPNHPLTAELRRIANELIRQAGAI
ncbi:MAG: CDP-3, 6-dideoxy-D-glycero-L-glycero-4-hexulose-4-reductase [Herpetosiphonaceae bacterium]|nr:MAG: CDP-3, 6-dideoxy-D-glycero-L-glycero-4-hexulose-4-reductase [Herpetosiphonaceae bacterium]